MRLIPGRDDNCVGVPLNGNGSGVAIKGSVMRVAYVTQNTTASVPEFLYGNRNAEYCSCQWNATAVKGLWALR